MAGFGAGQFTPEATAPLINRIPATWVPHLVRLSAVAPALLGVCGGARALTLWSGVLTVNAVAGATESAHRRARRDAVADFRWSQAKPLLSTGDAVVRITGWARPGRNGRWSVPARLLVWSGIGAGTGGSIRPTPGDGLLLSGQENPPDPGQIVAGPLELRTAPVAALPGAFDYRQFLAGRGLKWQARFQQHRVAAAGGPVAGMGTRILAPVRHSLLSRLARLLPEREASLAGAVLLGVRTADSKGISGPFNALGLAHLFAVSGLHVGILLGIILLPGRLAGVSPRLAALPLWLFLPLYLLLTGLPGSVVRAGGMGLLAAQARPLGRRVDPLRILGLLYWAGSLLDPTQNLDTGLQLSYLAAGGILLLSRATNGFRLTDKRWLRPVLAGLTVSFAAQWFTMPVVARSFGQISLLSPLANLVAIPLFGLAVWSVVLALVISVVSIPLAQDIAALAWLLLRGLSGVVAWLAGATGGAPWGLMVPGPWAVSVWLVLTLVLFWLLWLRGQTQRPWILHICSWCLLPVLLLQVFGPLGRDLPADNKVIVWQFDVGQGDCALLIFPDGWTALIDTGGRFGYQAPPDHGPVGRSVVPFLRRQGMSRLDAVLLTHGHLDHTGGALALAPGINVQKWYVAGRADAALGDQVDAARIVRPVAGEVLHRWRRWTLRIHYPLPGQDHAESENNWSLVAALSEGDRVEMVWSGDLEVAGEAKLLASAPPLRQTRVWKAGHHGSNTSGSAAFLQMLQPQLVLISCGVGNRYHHPSHGPYLVPKGSGTDTLAILRTDLDRSIELKWGHEGRLQWRTADSYGEITRSP